MKNAADMEPRKQIITVFKHICMNIYLHMPAHMQLLAPYMKQISDLYNYKKG